MDRSEWLAERRRHVVADYDDIAAEYDTYDYPRDAQAVWVGRLVATCPPGGVVLDAACGTGRYFPLVTGTGRHVVGIDQSAGMLAAAAALGTADALVHTGLQELALAPTFDAVMCIDAMEHVPPEDWPTVLANLGAASRPGAHLYLTVEEMDDDAVDARFAALQADGLPAVRGEIVDPDAGGYHYYPRRERLGRWLADAGLTVVDELYVPEDGWGYRHLLLRRDT